MMFQGKGMQRTYWLDGKDGNKSVLPDVFKRIIPADEINPNGK